MITARPHFSRALAFAKQHERRLGAVLFAFGFFTDFFTFGFLPVSVVNIIFLCYLALAGACALGAHAFAAVPAHALWWQRALSIIFPLGVQYAFGGLLSGLVVFYTAHSVVLASWPFLLVLVLVYVGNEYFRMYKHFLVFQTTLFFFTLYAYSIFALPLVVKSLGPLVFLGSTMGALLVFALFLWTLRTLNRKRFDEEFRPITASVLGTVLLVGSAYFAGLIPPIPLALKDSGVYHTLTRVSEGYQVSAEVERPWFDIRTEVVHLPLGAPLYVYSAVAAPISFASTVVHRWERYREGKGWVTENRIAFPISGGREGGYRGYSLKEFPAEGRWRVSVETPGGQVIGRIRFDIAKASEPPALIDEIL